METLKKLTVSILIVIVSLIIFCTKDDESIVGPDIPTDNLPEKKFGLKLIPSSQYSSIPIADLPAKGTLPARYELSNNFPVPGNQGKQNSCVGWAVAYALKSYQEQIERKWSLISQEHLFSPSFIYNQINNGLDGGSYITSALNLMQSQGCAPLSLMPYNETDYVTKPSTAAKSEALKYKINYWRRTNHISQQEIKTHLYADYPVIIAVEVGTNFYNLSKTNPYRSVGTFRGHHAVVLTGYDDSYKVFKFINSWGTGYSDRGYGYIAYDFFPEAVKEAYIARDINDVINEIITSLNSPANGATVSFPLKFSWSASDQNNVSEYELELSSSSSINNSTGKFQTLILSKRLNNPEYTITNLNQGKYYWHVRARNGLTGSWDSWSVIRNFTVPTSNHAEIRIDGNISPYTYDYGTIEIGHQSWHNFIISNPGNTTLTVHNLYGYGTNSSDFILSAGSFPLNVEPNQTKSFTFLFMPSGEGLKTSSIRVSNNSTTFPNFIINLRGTGKKHSLEIDRIEITPSSVTLYKGHTQQFTCTAYYSDNSTKDVTNLASWITTASGTINNNGLFTATSTGSGNVTASYSGKTSSANIEIVSELIIDNVWLQLTRQTSLSGSQFHVKLYANTGNWSESSLKWSTRPGFKLHEYGSDHFYSSSDFKITHLRDLVRDWVEGSISNYGILIIPVLSDIDGQEWFLFRDRESGSPPILTIKYIYRGVSKEVNLKPTDDVYIGDRTTENKDGEGLFIGKRGSPAETCHIYIKYNLNLNW